MIRHSGERLVIEGALTNANVGGMVEAGRHAVATGATVVDLSAVTQVDSAAIALILDWTRAAGRALVLHGAPESFQRLVRLYGVEDVLRPAK